jgi:HAD superfamily hydrolase (TIGR01509 family)
MAKAVIFDFDGVLVESESHWSREQQAVYARMVPDWKAEDLKAMKGLSLRDEHARLSATRGLKMPFDEYERTFDSLAGAVYSTHATLIEGMRQVLETLHSAGVPMAIASSSNRAWIEIALKRFGLESFFSAVTTWEDVPRGKPFPDVYLAAAARLSVEPALCVVVEDSPAGITAGKAAGMHVIAMRTAAYAEADLREADAIASDAPELSALFA